MKASAGRDDDAGDRKSTLAAGLQTSQRGVESEVDVDPYSLV
jgi:hypothetical protein